VVKVEKYKATLTEISRGLLVTKMSFLRGHFWLLSLFLALLRECSLSAQAAHPQPRLNQQLLRFND
jgi:hypothetical protein